ncbi:response regulator [Leptolyngbya sp. AN02str]|uniref:response regulator n=1 Tax=Leptolyngbya sp. AN02str TaxID=3423363 RepID=UPI003D320789
MRILVVEDDDLLAQAITNILAKQQHVVDMALDGDVGQKLAIATSYDLIVLDVMLPKLDGVSLCRQLRQTGNQAPILLLTAKNSPDDKVIGLDAGADDYVVKPVNFDEFLARVRALLRRGLTTPSVLTWTDLTLDPTSLEVTYDGHALNLTATEHRLLELFLRNPQRVFSRSAIVEHLWAFGDQPEAATVKTYIKNLRQKLKAVGAPTDLIKTVYGLGYRLKPDPYSENAVAQPAYELAEQSWKEQKVFHAVARARDSFKNKICDRLRIFQQTVKELEIGVLTIELHKQAINEAHRFAGTLGTFGLTEASQFAEAIENLLQIYPLSLEQAQQLRQLVEKLSTELETFLFEPTFNPEIDSTHPQLWLLSDDNSWLQTLAQFTDARSIEVKSVSIPPGVEWIPQVLHRIQLQPPNVLLIDVDIAPLSQITTLITELSEQLSMPVLVIAKNDDFAQRLEISKCGAYRFLLKTMPLHLVLDQITQSLQYAQLRGSRILAVDSDRQTLMKIRHTLTPWRLQVKLLDDPQQFWQTLNEFLPHLLLLSVDMPNLTGIDLCQVTRTDPFWSQIPILFLTSRGSTEAIHQLFIFGADDYISKPIAREDLLTRTLNRLARSGGKKSIISPA